MCLETGNKSEIVWFLRLALPFHIFSDVEQWLFVSVKVNDREPDAPLKSQRASPNGLLVPQIRWNRTKDGSSVLQEHHQHSPGGAVSCSTQRKCIPNHNVQSYGTKRSGVLRTQRS